MRTTHNLFEFPVYIYKITNGGLVGIGCQWLPMATNNLPIDYQCTMMALTKFLPIMMIGKNW